MCSLNKSLRHRRCHYCLLLFVTLSLYLLRNLYLSSKPRYRSDVLRWAQKNLNVKLPKTDKDICFVHVGKTAGSTLACYLGFMYPACEKGDKDNELAEAIPIAPGLLPAATTHLIHTNVNDCVEKDFDYYLFVLRDPLKRIQSWFNYELPDGRLQSGIRLFKQRLLFTECNFSTLNALGEIGLAPRDMTNATELCRTRAHMAITGFAGFSTHNYYNFGFYLRAAQSQKDLSGTIVVLRTEHLTADWKSIEEDILHGPKDLNVTFSRKGNVSPTRPEVTYLSATAKRRICAKLCEEIQVYKSLLREAINLNDNDVAQSMTELKESCPVEAAVTACEA